MEGCTTTFPDGCFKLSSEVMTDEKRIVCVQREVRDLKLKLTLLKLDILYLVSHISEKMWIVDLISEVLDTLTKMLLNPTNMDFTKLTELKEVIRNRMTLAKEIFPMLVDHFPEIEKILIKLDFININDQEKRNIWIEMNYLSYKLKNIRGRKMSEDDEKDFLIMSEIFMKYLPKLGDPSVNSKIDHILYKNEEKDLIEGLLASIDLHVYLYAYLKMVIDKNVVNRCLDNAFLKLVEHKARTKNWHLDGFILQLLESKNMHRICIGLKIFKTYFKEDGFKYHIGRGLYYAMSDLSKIPYFVDRDENEMARFVAKNAKECHDLIESNDNHAPAYQAHDIFEEIKERDVVEQYQIRALYKFIKSSKSSEIVKNMLGYGSIESVVSTFLHYIRRFYKNYEELDKEMREMDAHNGQGFGEFSLEVVADDDVKKKKKKKKKPLKVVADDDEELMGASNGLKKKTPIKYFFYDDAMKTLSILSFLYNYLECNLDYYKDELQHFKIGKKCYVTKFVKTLIHELDFERKKNRPVWIMEKILNTCPFIVFGPDQKDKENLILKLVNGQINEDELIRLMRFKKKTGVIKMKLD